MSPDRALRSWLEHPELATAQPLEMQAGWIADCGLLLCARCGAPIRPAEQFRLAGRCSMGGVVPAAQFTLYADMLEPHAEHVTCAYPFSQEPAAT